MKCKECKFYEPSIDQDIQDDWGDCANPLIRGKSGLISIVYCEEFLISKDFGYIYAEAKDDNSI